MKDCVLEGHVAEELLSRPRDGFGVQVQETNMKGDGGWGVHGGNPGKGVRSRSLLKCTLTHIKRAHLKCGMSFDKGLHVCNPPTLIQSPSEAASKARSEKKLGLELCRVEVIWGHEVEILGTNENRG